jgi:hypothetical protein
MQELNREAIEEEAARSNSHNTYASIAKPEFRKVCDQKVAALIRAAIDDERVQAGSGASDPELTRKLFIRSTQEAVLRIDMMRKINPLVCNKVAWQDPLLCKQWGLYAADEGLHSRLFAKDLYTLGLKESEIYGIKPLFATELLAGWLYQTLEDDGALATLASAYYVETVSSWTQPEWLDRMEQAVGSECTKGARAHLAFDSREDHIDLAWNMCMRMVKTSEDEQRFVRYVERLHSLFVAYIIEVGQVVRGGHASEAPISAIQTSVSHAAASA